VAMATASSATHARNALGARIAAGRGCAALSRRFGEALALVTRARPRTAACETGARGGWVPPAERGA
jgi:hypothetical protein